jgi:hypothetical protein
MVSPLVCLLSSPHATGVFAEPFPSKGCFCWLSADMPQYVHRFGSPMELRVVIIDMCLNKARGKVRISEYLTDPSPFQNGLKQNDDLSLLIFNFASEYTIR